MNTHTRSIHRRQSSSIRVPAHVPIAERRRYIYSYSTVTRGTGRLMLMAGDQKIEHLILCAKLDGVDEKEIWDILHYRIPSYVNFINYKKVAGKKAA